MKANISAYVFACCAVTFSAAAQAPRPSAEFWEYLLEFSDETGELLDPLELAQLSDGQFASIPAASERNALPIAPNEGSPQVTPTQTSQNPRTSSSAEESSQ